jgi:hypothetical protein
VSCSGCCSGSEALWVSVRRHCLLLLFLGLGQPGCRSPEDISASTARLFRVHHNGSVFPQATGPPCAFLCLPCRRSYHYLVPELDDDFVTDPDFTPMLDKLERGQKALGKAVGVPIVIGAWGQARSIGLRVSIHNVKSVGTLRLRRPDHHPGGDRLRACSPSHLAFVGGLQNPGACDWPNLEHVPFPRIGASRG